jgi:tRNA G10  N-methylase Trm11
MLQRSLDPLSRPFDDELDALLSRFRRGRALQVDFRELVGNSSATDRFTHRMHPYPAKLLLNIPLFFLNCGQLLKPGAIVYDPFCGSGTVLVEGLVRGAVVQGADSNPLARLVTHAKTTPISEDVIDAGLEVIWSSLPRRGAISPSGSVDLETWFSPKVLSQLSRLRRALESLAEGPAERFFKTCFSAVVSRVALTDPTVPVPVRIDTKRKSLTKNQRRLRKQWLENRSTADVFGLFELFVEENFERLRLLSEQCSNPKVSLFDDARTAPSDDLVDLVISSPPYGSAQKYIRSSSLSLQWLGMASTGLRELERQSIGREHFSRSERAEIYAPLSSSRALLDKVGKINPLRRHIASTFLIEMSHALSRTYSRLRLGGHLVLIVGNNTVCGHIFNTQNYLTEICERLGLELQLRLEDRIRSRGLITKRHSTAGLISKETILLFKKSR